MFNGPVGHSQSITISQSVSQLVSQSVTESVTNTYLLLTEKVVAGRSAEELYALNRSVGHGQSVTVSQSVSQLLSQSQIGLQIYY